MSYVWRYVSSSWEAESRKNNTWNTRRYQPWMASPLREQIKQFQDTQVVKEFTDAVETKRLKRYIGAVENH
jgi:hypothetical protein